MTPRCSLQHPTLRARLDARRALSFRSRGAGTTVAAADGKASSPWRRISRKPNFGAGWNAPAPVSSGSSWLRLPQRVITSSTCGSIPNISGWSSASTTARRHTATSRASNGRWQSTASTDRSSCIPKTPGLSRGSASPEACRPGNGTRGHGTQDGRVVQSVLVPRRMREATPILYAPSLSPLHLSGCFGR